MLQARRSRTPSSFRALLLAALLAPTTGCLEPLIGGAALGAIGGAVVTRDVRVKPGASVRVELDQPRDVHGVRRGSAAGDTVALRQSRQLFGRVERVAGDSVWIAISEVRGDLGPTRFRLGAMPVALVRQEPGVRILPLANRPSYIVAGGLLGTGIGVLVIIIGCALDPCLS
jgi:hypothetical protein